MKTKKLLISILFALLSAGAYAQGENNVWCFGHHLGLDFNGGGPVFYNDTCNTTEAAASLSDKDGHLMFYSDGTNIYNRIHQVMPNGSGILGHSSSTQGVAIASYPDSDSLFYIFTVTATGVPGYLRYSVVDMSLDGGMGDVIASEKNVLIGSNISEKMIIAGACSNQWLITHHADSAIFYAYPISSGSFIPVISKSGVSKGASTYSFGEMKISKDFRKLALANTKSTFAPFQASVELHDFDPVSGIVNHFELLDSFGSVNIYGTEFSPGGTKLYVSATTTVGLYQYDLSSGSISTIRASRYLVKSGPFWGLRTGPDGMIYVLNTSIPNNFSRIRAPELAGLACDYQANFLTTSFTNFKSCFSFGNQFVKNEKADGDTVYKKTAYIICAGKSVTIKKTGASDFYWFDGDTVSTKTFSGSGSFWLRSLTRCGVSFDTFAIAVVPPDTIFSRKLDTLVCEGTIVKVLVEPGRESYQWNDGDTSHSKDVRSPAVFTVSSRKDCHVYIDTFHIRGLPMSVSTFKTDTFVCKDDSVLLSARSAADSILWWDGSKEVARSFKASAIPYWVRSYKECSLTVDTFFIHTKPYDTVNIVTDTLICFLNEARIIGQEGFNSYLWESGSNQKDTTVYNDSKLKLTAINQGNCQILEQQFNISFIDFEIVQKDTFTCNDDTITLDASINIPGAKYRWENGDTTSLLKISSAGSRKVAVTVGHCTKNGTFDIANRRLNAAITGDSIVCAGNKAILKAQKENLSYLWSTGDTVQTIEVTKGGIYKLNISDHICQATSEINVNMMSCDNCVSLPNAFTPNSDGKNDFFKPILRCPSVSYHLRIMNRYGQVVFKTDNATEKWDGTSDGTPLDVGVYFFMLKIKFIQINGIEKILKGDITLIR